MKTIIINGQRELAELPKLWYTDGTDEANEWGRGIMTHFTYPKEEWIGNGQTKGFVGATWEGGFKDKGFTYITPSEFLRLVYEPWKESQKVKLPSDYSQLRSVMLDKSIDLYGEREYLPNHINACIQLTNIMKYANDAFEGDGTEWIAARNGSVYSSLVCTHPIRVSTPCL